MARELEAFIGRVAIAVRGMEVHSELVEIYFSNFTRLCLFHRQDCCESVCVVDVAGEPGDLLGSELRMCEAVDSSAAEPPEHPDSWSATWFKFRTIKGDITLRWLGESNGYYGETPHLEVDNFTLADLEPKEAVLLDAVLEGRP